VGRSVIEWDPRFPLGLLEGKEKRRERTKDFLGDFRPHHCRHYIYTSWIYYYSVHIFLISHIYIYIFRLLSLCVCVFAHVEKEGKTFSAAGNDGEFLPILILISNFFFRG
jgi:hypothetical protein